MNIILNPYAAIPPEHLRCPRRRRLESLQRCVEIAANDSATNGSVVASGLLSAQDEETLDHAFYVSELARLEPGVCSALLDVFQLASYGIRPADVILDGHAVLQLIAERHSLDVTTDDTITATGGTAVQDRLDEMANDNRPDTAPAWLPVGLLAIAAILIALAGIAIW